MIISVALQRERISAKISIDKLKPRTRYGYSKRARGRHYRSLESKDSVMIKFDITKSKYETASTHFLDAVYAFTRNLHKERSFAVMLCLIYIVALDSHLNVIIITWSSLCTPIDLICR